MSTTRTLVTLLLLAVSSLACAGRVQNGRQGVNGLGIPIPDLSGLIDGSGQIIGQVELGRPGDPAIDDPFDSNSGVAPAAIFFADEELDTPAELQTEANRPVVFADRSHATEVAGVIVSNNIQSPGIARGASIFSSYFTAPNQTSLAETYRSLLGIQRLASYQAIEGVPGPKIINLSYDTGSLTSRFDGTDQSALWLDYLAHRFDTLMVKAGNENPVTTPAIGELATSFNGIVVGASRSRNGAYSRSAPLQRPAINTLDPPGPRHAVDILAPGEFVRTTSIGLTDPTPAVNGTSYAAPYVSGAAAMLRQRGQFEIDNNGTGFSDNDGLRHEVLKAVILNSADKVPDAGNGFNLLSARPVVQDINASPGWSWFQSSAFNTAAEPLDQEIGVGHLNIARAMFQYGQGEFDVTNQAAVVPSVGWDYHRAPNLDVSTFEPEYVKYTIDQTLPMNSVISATLAWDRQPTFVNDDNLNGLVDVDFFTDQGVVDVDLNLTDSFDEFALPFDFYDNLNLYVVPEGATSIAQAIPNGASNCPECTTEHLFVPVPADGRYEIWVERLEDTFITDYALAWWAWSPPIPGLDGDLNFDGQIDGSDLQWWALNFGETVDPGTNGDANSDGVVDIADYTVWRDAFASSLTATTSAVPEPSSAILLLIAAGRTRRRA